MPDCPAASFRNDPDEIETDDVVLPGVVDSICRAFLRFGVGVRKSNCSIHCLFDLAVSGGSAPRVAELGEGLHSFAGIRAGGAEGPAFVAPTGPPPQTVDHCPPTHSLRTTFRSRLRFGGREARPAPSWPSSSSRSPLPSRRSTPATRRAGPRLARFEPPPPRQRMPSQGGK